MKLRLIILSLLALMANPVTAETPMSGAAFEAYSQGKTLYFGFGGGRYGAEEYLPNRRVRWSFLDGICQDGEWYQDGELICFVYQDNPDPQCWSFYQRGSGLMAQFENDPDQTTLFEVEQGNKPMICLGPEIGV